MLCVWLPNWPRQRPKGAREHELTDREALKRLVAWCEQFSPTVGLESSSAPESLLFDVTGLAPLFHGEAALIEHVAREFRRRGYTVRLALADTLGAAWAMAHYGPQKIGTLTSSATEKRTVAEFVRIPNVEEPIGTLTSSATEERTVAEFVIIPNVEEPIGTLTSSATEALTVAEFVRIPNVEEPIGTLTSSATEFRYMTDEAIILPPGHGLAALASLPLEALRLTPETVRTLRELGLVRIGQLSSLQRAGLATRFGGEPLLRLDQAAGEVAEVPEVHHPPPEARANWTFEPPTARHDLIDWALGRLVERVVDQLADRRRGVQQLECRMRGQTTAHARFSVGLFRPSVTPRHLEELVKLRLETHPLAEPVAGLELLVTATAPLEERQRELFAGAAGVTAQRGGDDSRALALLIDRLSNRLGRAAVVRARLLPDAQPEFAWRYEPAIGRSEVGSRKSERKSNRHKRDKLSSSPTSDLRLPTLFRLPTLSRPLCLLPQPLPLVVGSIVPDRPPRVFASGGVERRIERTWGPERIQTGWWRAPSVARDYYRVETAGGQWFWLFRQLTDGRWFLHGVFE